MIREKSSVASVLEKIVTKVEELGDDASAGVGKGVKRKLNAKHDSSKKVRLSLQDSFEELHCRICYDSSLHLPIIYPCKCKGTMGAIHLKCLEHWLEESNRNSCELCGHKFDVTRTPRYSVLQSIIIWMCLDQRQHQLHVRSLKADLFRSAIITPLAIGCCYVCIVAADFYAKNNYDNFPPARWTTYLLLAMMTLLLFSYFVWMYMAIQYHQRIWFYWWQKTSTVKIILTPENRTPINYKSDVSQV